MTTAPQRVRLRPRSPELIVRDPDNLRPLPAEGAEVRLSSYWRRRIADGDVLEVEAGGSSTSAYIPPDAASGPRSGRKGS